MDEELETRLIELENRITFVLEGLTGHMNRTGDALDSVFQVLERYAARLAELERPVRRVRVRRIPRA